MSTAISQANTWRSCHVRSFPPTNPVLLSPAVIQKILDDGKNGRLNLESVLRQPIPDEWDKQQEMFVA